MLDDIISARKAHFADGVQTVMRGHENRSRRVVLMKGNLVSNGRSESRGISARVTKNTRMHRTKYGRRSDAQRTLRLPDFESNA